MGQDYVGNWHSSNRFQIETDGTPILRGDATVFEDISTSLIGRRLFDAVGSVTYDYDNNAVVFGASGDITDNADCVAFNVQKPHGAKQESSTDVHIHWEQIDDTAREFTLRYRIQTNGGETVSDWVEVVVSTADNNVFEYPGSGTLNQITRLTNIDLSEYPISSIIQIRMTRSDAVADAGIKATFIDMHIEYDSMGSRDLYVK